MKAILFLQNDLGTLIHGNYILIIKNFILMWNKDVKIMTS